MNADEGLRDLVCRLMDGTPSEAQKELCANGYHVQKRQFTNFKNRTKKKKSD